MPTRPSPSSLIGKDPSLVPLSCQRVLQAATKGEHVWIGPEQAATMAEADRTAYDAAHTIMRHIAVRAPVEHQSGHPGGPLSAFTFAYAVTRRRDPAIDQPLRYSAGHLSLLAYTLQWLFGNEGDDERLQSPEAIIRTFRIPDGLPGHVEAGIGDIPFGTGPLGKGVSNALGAAFGLNYLRTLQPTTHNPQPHVDVLMADGDSQEGQIMEAFRLAPALRVDNLIVHGDFNDIQLSDMPSKTMASDFASIAHAAGWHVIEVQNGNDLAQVTAALDRADALCGKGRPVFVCYYTTMGSGISFMEEGSNTGTKNYHGAPLSTEEAEKALKELPPMEDAIKTYEPFRNMQNAKCKMQNDPLHWDVDALKKKGYTRTITEKPAASRKEFGATHLKNLMKADERIVVLHADLAGSGGFDAAEKDFPGRVINVGVAEANMAMMAAGMRQVGLLPVTYTFGAFATNEARASARLIDINCAHTRCGVLHDATHVGLSVGEDGETHQEQNYLNLPFHHTQVWMPADSNQAAAMAERGLEVIAEGSESVFVFHPRTGHPQLTSPDGTALYGPGYRFTDLMDLVRGAGDATDVLTIIATGSAVHTAVAAADELHSLPESERLSVRVLNAACIRPLDAAAVITAAYETQHLLVLEDHNTEGGLASQVADVIADFQLPCSLRRIGLTHYFPSGKAEDLAFFAGLDTESVLDAIQDEIRLEVCGGEDAFVTSVFSLLQNARHSRFAPSVLPLIDALIADRTLLDRLRAVWQERTCPPDKLPDNDRLREKLGEVRSMEL